MMYVKGGIRIIGQHPNTKVFTSGGEELTAIESVDINISSTGIKATMVVHIEEFDLEVPEKNLKVKKKIIGNSENPMINMHVLVDGIVQLEMEIEQIASTEQASEKALRLLVEAEALENKMIKNQVVIPGKLINFITK